MYVAKSLLNEINFGPNNKGIFILYLILCFRLRMSDTYNLTQFVYLYFLRIVSIF